MTKKIFCHNCGKQQSFGHRFCADCGTSLASLSSKPEPPPKPEREKPSFTPFAVDREDDDDSYIDHMEHLDIRINKLEFEVAQANYPQKETIRDIARGEPVNIEPRAPQYTPENSDKVRQDFLKEAGTLRNE